MYVVVVPAQNESGRIGIVLKNLLRVPFNTIIPVINGCTDSTLGEVQRISDPRIRTVYFKESLGIDIPRAIGALFARKLGAEGIVFVDGDMIGDFHPHLLAIIEGLKQGTDLALVNCYPYITNRQKLAATVLHFRGRLNRELGLFKDLGLASPTHGPHGISANLLSKITCEDIAVPPVVLVKASDNKFRIKVVTSIPHSLLSSPVRDRSHARKVAHTIIGDCLQALAISNGDNPNRSYGKHTFLGYHPDRRFDLLNEWKEGLDEDNQDYLKSHLLI